MSDPLPPKKEIALALLERSSVHVHLDPRAQGVLVPAWFKKQPQLVLQIGLNMPVPIPDLRLDEEGLSCTLSFNRTGFFCVVPWPSVYALVGDDGRGMVWPDNVPPEVANQAKNREGDGAAAKRAGPRRVVSPAPSPSGGASASASDGNGRSSPNELRAADGDASVSKAKKPKKRGRADATAREGRDGAEASPQARPNLVAVPAAPGPSKPAPHALPTSKSGGYPPNPQAKSGGYPPNPQSKSGGYPPNLQRTPRGSQSGHVGSEAPPVAPAPQPAPGVIQVERRPNNASPRPKRELPPYLRVVK